MDGERTNDVDRLADLEADVLLNLDVPLPGT
jgi:hypothetical protein